MQRNREKGRAGGRVVAPGYRSDILDVLEGLLADRPEVTRGKMFGFPAFYTGGKLFACVYGDGVGLKLPREMIGSLQGKPGITPFRPYGKPPMKEWIQICHARAEGYAGDSRLFQESVAFVLRTAKTRGKSQLRKRISKMRRGPSPPGA